MIVFNRHAVRNIRNLIKFSQKKYLQRHSNCPTFNISHATWCATLILKFYGPFRLRGNEGEYSRIDLAQN